VRVDLRQSAALQLGFGGQLKVDVGLPAGLGSDAGSKVVLQKFGGDFLADFEVFQGNAGTDGGDEGTGDGAGFVKRADGFFDDVPDDPAPTGMGRGDILPSLEAMRMGTQSATRIVSSTLGSGVTRASAAS